MCAKRRIVAIKAIGVIFLLLAALIFTRDEVSMSGNEASRFAVIQAVGEQGVCHIENTTFRTVDAALKKELAALDKLSGPALARQRYQMFRAMGQNLPPVGKEEA